MSGRVVAGTSGPLIIPPNVPVADVRVTDDRQVHAGHAPGGKLRIEDFPHAKDKLQPVGESCFTVPKEAEPAEPTEVVVKQGYQDASNVKLVDEMVNMILVSRMYEANMRLVSVKRDSTNAAMGVAMG